MEKRKFDLNSIKIASPCHVPWGTMNGDERVRHCGSCEMNVFNVSNMTADDAEKLFRTHEGRLCIRLYRRADGTVITKDCPVGRMSYRKRAARSAGAVLAALVGLFSVSFGQKEDIKTIDAAKYIVSRTVGTANESVITGIVLDPYGAVIPGAKITLFTSTEKRTATSDTNGEYVFAGVAPGTWSLTARYPGFKELRIKELKVNPKEQIQFNIQLFSESGSVTVGIYVDEDSPNIDASLSGTTTFIGRRKLDSIPD